MNHYFVKLPIIEMITKLGIRIPPSTVLTYFILQIDNNIIYWRKYNIELTNMSEYTILKQKEMSCPQIILLWVTMGIEKRKGQRLLRNREITVYK